MTKRILYITVLILATLLLIFIFINPAGIFSGGQPGIQISDTASVSRIEIYGRDTIVLERTSTGQWLFNNEYKVNQISISNFLYCFRKMSVKGITYNPEEADTTSIRIRVYSGKKKYFYRFYPANDKSLLHREGSKKIYSVEVPAAPEAKLAGVFSDDPDHWRDRTILDLLPEELSVVKVEHPGFPDKDFIVRMEDNVPVLYEPGNTTKVPVNIVDNEELLMYVSYFMNIFYDHSIKDVLPPGQSFAENPRYIVTVTSSAGITTKISVFPIYTNNQEDIFNAGIKIDENPEMLVCRYIAIDLLLRSKKDFLKISYPES